MATPSSGPAAPRGRLTLFLAPSPGAGKTRRLLAEAARQQAQGVDVVLAAVAPRGRPAVEQLRVGLEPVPPRRFAHHGVEGTEMDVAAVVARRPRLAIVDDLAHVNAPGSPHLRRHHDVAALLAEGIDVLSALDVGQLDGYADLAEQVSGARAGATVPDAVLLGAEVLACDVGEGELRARLEAGLVYGPEKVAWAREHGFRLEALRALRELALRAVADHLARQASGPPLPARAVSGRVMVGLSSFSPRSLALLRRGARIAGRLNTGWFVVYVRTPAEAPGRLRPEVQQALEESVARARDLGAEVVFVEDEDPVEALLGFARSHGVAHLVVGRSPQPWWRWPARRSLVGRLLREADDLDLYVLGAQEAEP